MNKRKNILIIGNGRSVLNQELGKYVDSFSLVGRINNYSIDNYSKFIGNKTNIWFNGANQNLKKQKYIPNEVIVFIPPEIMRRKQNNIHKRIINRLNVKENQYSLIPLETMEKYESISGIKRLTTGTASILWAIDNIETKFSVRNNNVINVSMQFSLNVDTTSSEKISIDVTNY